MKRVLGLIALGLALGCTDSVGPVAVYPGYSLSQLDGQYLPIPWGGDGSVLLALSLSFVDEVRPRSEGPVAGTVSYTTLIRPPNQTAQRFVIDLDYSVENGILRINLCPPLALCITSTELVGSITAPYDELVLTHYLGGNPGSVYRFFPALAE